MQKRPLISFGSTLAVAVVIAVAVPVLIGGCMPPASGGGPSGLDQAPDGLDPSSPALVAKDIAFDRTELAAPGSRPFVVVLRNADGAPHNVSVYRDATYRDRVFEGKVIDGGSTTWYPVPALAPGRYFFQCDVHPIPAMQGIITVP